MQIPVYHFVCFKFTKFDGYDFISALETLQQNRRHSMFFLSVNLGEMVMCLEDLINYFQQPDDNMGMQTVNMCESNFDKQIY